MKKIKKIPSNIRPVLIIVLFLFAKTGLSQKDSSGNIIDKTAATIYISDGKKKFFKGNIRGGLIKFREAIQKNKTKASAYFWTAMCHQKLHNYDYALKYVNDAIEIDSLADREVDYLKGAILHKQGKLDEAIDAYSRSLKYVKNNRIKDLRIENKIEECKRAKKMIDNPTKAKLSVMSSKINSRTPDYAPVLADSGKTMYFVSRRSNTTGAGLNPYDNLFYEDVYVSYKEEGGWTRATNDSKEIKRLNTDGFDAVNTLGKNGTEMYLTLNTDGLGKKKINPETDGSDICRARLSKKDRWNSPKILQGGINSGYFDGGITLTKDATKAFFISERKDRDAMGRRDIWMAESRKGRSFENPKNLGEPVNTRFKEVFCYISPDGQYLFFSSDGHKGMGGYDIYVSKNEPKGWSKPVNLGYPINTTDDDVHFRWNPEFKTAHYSTIPKENGKGKRDIIEVDLSSFDMIQYIDKKIKEQKEKKQAEQEDKKKESKKKKPVKSKAPVK